MTRRTKIVTFGCVAALAATVFAAQTARQLVIDGKVVSSEVMQQDGRYYVPLDDVAKYFGYGVNINGNQATLNRIAMPPAQTGGTAGQGVDIGTVGTATLNQTSYLSMAPTPQPVPTKITSTLGQSASVDGFDYTITSIQDVGPKYTDAYDQRARTIHARYKNDSLVVVTIKETNRSSTPVAAVFPNVNDITVFDGKQVGYRSTYLDARQSVDLANAAFTDDMATTNIGAPSLMLGPGGTLQFAVVASIPKGDQIQSVMVNVPARGGTNASGAILMIARQ